jgi:hypothetical protein
MDTLEPTGLDLFDLSYLARGTPRQRDAHRVIEERGLWRDLTAFRPALAGTVPLDVDLAHSDLDVICEAHDLDAFAARVEALYGLCEGFCLARYPVRGVESVVSGFRLAGWSFELFAQPVPADRQWACLHLVAEARLLLLGGEPARQAVRELKRQGYRTEPAFAHTFGLPGDPYEELARLARVTDEVLRAVAGRGKRS